MSIIQLRAALKKKASVPKARVMASFFKTGPGQYAAGDVFIGVPVPDQRAIARQCTALVFKDIGVLLKSGVHEERLTALLILVGQMKGAAAARKERIAAFYLKNLAHVNNWDLVDQSAYQILGAHLYGKKEAAAFLLKMARSRELWERRVAMVATFYFIKNKSAQEALAVAEVLLKDDHDLMHKAVGWMLREVGKRVSQDILEKFLLRHYKDLSRTTLRYAIERFPEAKRKIILRHLG